MVATVVRKRRRHPKIYVGDKYGDLEVIEDLGIDNTHHHYYSCKCHMCGNETRELREKIVTAIDKNKELRCSRCSFIKDRTGIEKDGYRVLHIVEGATRDRHSFWSCECMTCGQVKVFSTKQLASKSSLPKCIHINARKMFESYKGYQLTASL